MIKVVAISFVIFIKLFTRFLYSVKSFLKCVNGGVGLTI